MKLSAIEPANFVQQQGRATSPDDFPVATAVVRRAPATGGGRRPHHIVHRAKLCLGGEIQAQPSIFALLRRSAPPLAGDNLPVQYFV